MAENIAKRAPYFLRQLGWELEDVFFPWETVDEVASAADAIPASYYQPDVSSLGGLHDDLIDAHSTIGGVPYGEVIKTQEKVTGMYRNIVDNSFEYPEGTWREVAEDLDRQIKAAYDKENDN